MEQQENIDWSFDCSGHVRVETKGRRFSISSSDKKLDAEVRLKIFSKKERAWEEGANVVAAPARNGVPGTKLQSCRLRVLIRGNM